MAEKERAWRAGLTFAEGNGCAGGSLICILFGTFTDDNRQMATLKTGEKIKLIKINLEGVTYRDWMSERDPIPGDIARVEEVFNGDVTTYRLACEPAPGFLTWGATVLEPFIEYEILC